MSEHHTESMMEKTIEKIKSMVTSDTIIGAPIVVGQVTLIPVSKVTYGFAAGGTDHASKHNTTKDLYGGGAGAGITIAPVGFVSVCGTSVKMLPVNPAVSTADRIVEMVPDTVDKITGFVQDLRQKKVAKEAMMDEIAQEVAEAAVSEIDKADNAEKTN
ncbi:MAG: sporulation protein YtfJ [Clostridia bacterium]|nr:sporulation protein YtfJ [Clostridia bacterium]